MTNKKLIEIYGRLNALKDLKLPVRASYALIKNINTIEAEYDIYMEAQREILKKHVGEIKADDNGNVIFPDDKAKAKSLKELKELNEIEVDIDIKKISLDDLGELTLSTSEMLALEFMIL